jgi:hypothetical protein
MRSVVSSVTVLLAALTLWGCAYGAPEIPANAAIDFGTSWQMGDAQDAATRVCSARKDEFLDPRSRFHSDLESTLGAMGLSHRGWPEETLPDGTVLVYLQTGHRAPPPGQYVTGPGKVFAFEMVKEGGRWKVCGLRWTGELVPGFDARVPCEPGERPPPEDPGFCRPG